MSYLQGVVYDPPSPDLPPLIVVFKNDGAVLAARAAPSLEAADAILERVMQEVQDKIDEGFVKQTTS